MNLKLYNFFLKWIAEIAEFQLQLKLKFVFKLHSPAAHPS